MLRSSRKFALDAKVKPKDKTGLLIEEWGPGAFLHGTRVVDQNCVVKLLLRAGFRDNLPFREDAALASIDVNVEADDLNWRAGVGVRAHHLGG
jgi:hypothetical protein